jgi:UDPglucose 6-dehydrogenase
MGIGSDRRIGYHFIYPGVGYGGSCFPKDVKAFINTAKEYSYKADLVSAVDAVNNRQKSILAEKIKTYFDEQGGVSGKILAIWGLSFKANTDDIRESAAIETINQLTAKGMKVRAFDPEAGPNSQKKLSDNPLAEIIDDQYELLKDADALAILTDWNQFRNPDFNKIKKQLKAPIIFDGRNLYSSTYLSSQGFAYFGIGRPDVKS